MFEFWRDQNQISIANLSITIYRQDELSTRRIPYRNNLLNKPVNDGFHTQKA